MIGGKRHSNYYDKSTFTLHVHFEGGKIPLEMSCYIQAVVVISYGIN